MFYCGLMKVEKLKKCNVSNAGIAHVHLSETSDYLLGQVNNPLAVPSVK